MCISEKLDLGADVNCAVLASISRSWGERRGDREDSHRQTNTASALDRGRGGGHRNDSEAGHGHGRGLGRAVAGKMNKTKYFRLQLHDSNTGRLLEGNLKTARRLFEDLFKTASRPLKDLSQKDGY